MLHQPSPQLLAVPISDRDHVRGRRDAPLSLLEYGDYECPYCAAAVPVVEEVRRDLDDELAFAFRHFPLTTAHPHALRAAEAAEAADAQRRFWPMHYRLFAHQHELDDAALVQHAAALGLDTDQFIRDLLAHVHLPRIRDDMAGAVRSGVVGTPTFFVNGIRHTGAYDARTVIEALIATRPDA